LAAYYRDILEDRIGLIKEASAANHNLIQYLKEILIGSFKTT
jgi:hypothetical protein